jgi:hypothetical protein
MSWSTIPNESRCGTICAIHGRRLDPYFSPGERTGACKGDSCTYSALQRQTSVLNVVTGSLRLRRSHDISAERQVRGETDHAESYTTELIKEAKFSCLSRRRAKPQFDDSILVGHSLGLGNSAT